MAILEARGVGVIFDTESANYMITIKKLKRPTKLSGASLPQGETSELKKLGFRILNVSAGDGWHVDHKTPRRKK